MKPTGRQAERSRAPRKVRLATVLNVTLGAVIVLMAVFGYFYLRQRVPGPVKVVAGVGRELANLPPAWKRNITGPASSPLNRPLMVTVDDDGLVYVADTSNEQIQVFDRDGRWVRKFGRLGRGPGEFDFPFGLAIRNGRLYVADRENGRIQILEKNGRPVGQIPDPNKHKGLTLVPLGLFAGRDGNLYVSSKDNRILVFDREDKLVRQFGVGGPLPGQLSYPNGLVVDSRGRIWVSDSNNARIQVFSPDGRRVERIIEGFAVPQGIAIDDRDRVWVVDPLQHKLYVYDRDGNAVWDPPLGQRGTDNGQWNFPSGVFVKGDEIYVVDRGNSRIVVYGF